MKILAVDDDDLALLLLESTLADAGHEIVRAASGREALEMLHREPIRLVITDWVMPGMDGLELCRQIRRGAFPGYIYTILLTSRDRTQDIVEGLSAGADDFISKPFAPAELLVRLRAGERVLALETRNVAIFALAKLAESRDPETGHHLERIRNYCRILAADLALRGEHRDTVTAEFVEAIYLTSPLHDIGKVGIPDSVLLKPGRLNDAEFNVMKEHVNIGGETLMAAANQYPEAQFLRMAAEIALTHHEHYDGSGYPRGLAGDEIPLCGRIAAVADVYDALTSKRVYKEAYTHAVARKIVVGERGSHFDPAIVDAFLRNEEAFDSVRRAYSEQPAESPVRAW